MCSSDLAALFTIAKTWKQPKGPDEWIKKMWCICTKEYYSAIKKNEIMPFAATRMQLEILILSEISQTEKDKYHMILFIYGLFSLKAKLINTENKLAGVGGSVRWVKEAKRYKLPATNKSWGCNLQHGDYS